VDRRTALRAEKAAHNAQEDSMTKSPPVMPLLPYSAFVLPVLLPVMIVLSGCEAPPSADAQPGTQAIAVNPVEPSKPPRSAKPAPRQRIASGGRLQREKLRAKGEAPPAS
jgi:hypothetical protein